MKKYICVILIVLLICIIFTGCKREVGDTVDKFERFEIVKKLGSGDHYCDAYIIIDTQTNVEYLFIEYDHKIAITVLLNSDGTPMLWYGE
ncbi:MAG: hypothetical protein J6T10_28695 [Methanobrevibacter sp.]|nr:hypothetical protein [Methanobrevibacter sp.]